jgi:hypothetical protein
VVEHLPNKCDVSSNPSAAKKKTKQKKKIVVNTRKFLLHWLEGDQSKASLFS